MAHGQLLFINEIFSLLLFLLFVINYYFCCLLLLDKLGMICEDGTRSVFVDQDIIFCGFCCLFLLFIICCCRAFSMSGEQQLQQHNRKIHCACVLLQAFLWMLCFDTPTPLYNVHVKRAHVKIASSLYIHIYRIF